MNRDEMSYRFLFDTVCSVITPDDPSGNTRKKFYKGQIIDVMRKSVHSNGLRSNLIMRDLLVLDVDNRNIYPEVAPRVNNRK